MAQAPNPFEQQAPIPGVDKIIVVASGKGGVGKSTISSNIALALEQEDKKVGLLDADIYGPSIPRMFGTINQKPEVDAANKIQPIERHNIKLMSMGYLVEEDAAIVWRGPMLFKAIDQMLRDVDWGTLDYLVIDLPPGTGDVQLSLAQKVPLFGAITVTTPQNVALIDVKKALDMFERINTPIIGIVENMSYFLGPNEERLNMFPEGDLSKLLEQKKIDKISEIPFYKDIAFSGELGIPFIQQNKEHPISNEYKKLAQKILQFSN